MSQIESVPLNLLIRALYKGYHILFIREKAPKEFSERFFPPTTLPIHKFFGLSLFIYFFPCFRSFVGRGAEEKWEFLVSLNPQINLERRHQILKGDCCSFLPLSPWFDNCDKTVALIFQTYTQFFGRLWRSRKTHSVDGRRGGGSFRIKLKRKQKFFYYYYLIFLLLKKELSIYLSINKRTINQWKEGGREMQGEYKN